MIRAEHPRQMSKNQRSKTDRSANDQSPRASESKMTSAIGSIPQTLNRPVEVADQAAEAAHGWIVRIMDGEGPGILRLLWRLLGRESDVMDAYQDCFCKLVARKNCGKVKSEKAYAYRTAANIAVEMIRTRSRHRAHWPAIVAERNRNQDPPTTDIGAEESEDADAHANLRAAIAELPAHLRNVIVLRDLSRLPYEEVGKTLGIDPATARVYRRHAVVKLADLLGGGSE